MATTEFVSKATVITADWLNDVDALRYDNNGASLVKHTPAGAGAVVRTVSAKLADHVHIKDFGAACDGVTDDAAAVAAAVAALSSGGTLEYSGTPLLASTLTIDKRIRLLGTGGLATTPSDLPASYFIKKSTVSGAGINSTASGVIFDGGGLVCQAGNTGNGLTITGNSPIMKEFYVGGAGQDGIRLGADSGSNTNSFTLDNVRCHSSGRHGIYISDNTSPTGPDANGGTVRDAVCQDNAGDGLRFGNADFNTVIGGVFEGNTGYGIRIVTGLSNRIIGGDRESNGSGDGYIEIGSHYTELIGVRDGEVWADDTTAVGSTVGTTARTRDSRNWTFREAEVEWPLIVTGTTVTTKAVSAITRSGTTATATITGHTLVVGDRFHLLPGDTTHSADNPWGGSYTVASAPNADTITFTCNSALPTPATVTSMLAYCGYPTGSYAKGTWRRTGNWVTFSCAHTLDTGSLNALVTGNLRIFGLPFRVGNAFSASVFVAYIANCDTFQVCTRADTNEHGFHLIRALSLTAAAGAEETIPVSDAAINAGLRLVVSGTYKVG